MIFIIWIVASLFIGFMAKGAGRSFWIWFILSLIIDPILAFIIFLIAVRNR